MRILHITNAYPYAEYASYGIFVMEQMKSLSDLGLKTKTVFINARQRGDLEYLRMASDIRRAARCADLVHCHHAFSGLSYILSGATRPFVLSLLGDHERERPAIKAATRIAASQASTVIYKGRRPGLRGRLVHLPNGVDTNLFSPGSSEQARARLGLEPCATYVLFVSAAGSGNPVKRHDLFLAVLAELVSQGVPAHPLYLTGVERSLVPYYYQAANVLLQTSDHEGSPNCIKEAMVSEIPFVSTDVGNVREMASACPGCYIASTNSVGELSTLVAEALRYGPSAGRKRIRDLGLDASGVARRLMGIYEGVLRRSICPTGFSS